MYYENTCVCVCIYIYIYNIIIYIYLETENSPTHIGTRRYYGKIQSRQSPN